jgi:geranylgeranyl pyrophosphate synthase
MNNKSLRKFKNIKVKRTLNPYKRKVMKIFENKFLGKVERILKFNLYTEPIFYSLHIRSSKGRLFFLNYSLQKEFGASENLAFLTSMAIELLSAIDIALDDIIDNDTERGRVPTTWVKYGLRNTIASIKLVENKIFRLLETVDPIYYEIISQAYNLCYKRALIENKVLRQKISIKKYIRLAKFYTPFGYAIAKLLKFTKIDKKDWQNYWLFNKYHSIAWFFDDPLEVFSLEKGKKTYSDIRNGYYTLPIILLLNKKLNASEKEIFRKNFGVPNDKNAEKIVELLTKYNIRKECLKLIYYYNEKRNYYLKKFWKNDFSENLKLAILAYTYLRTTKLYPVFIK